MKNRKRNRMLGYDYSRDNLYFVTNCVKGMVCCLGEIILDDAPVGTGRDLSVRDLSVSELSVPDLSVPDPSAQHSDKKNPSISNKTMILNKYGEIVRDRLLWLEEQYPYVMLHNFVVMPNHLHAILEIDSLRLKNKSIKIKSLSSLLGAFETTSSKIIHQAGFLDFAWHRSFHDHIIRTDKSYRNISSYIDQNPSNWESDKFFR